MALTIFHNVASSGVCERLDMSFRHASLFSLSITWAVSCRILYSFDFESSVWFIMYFLQASFLYFIASEAYSDDHGLDRARSPLGIVLSAALRTAFERSQSSANVREGRILCIDSIKRVWTVSEFSFYFFLVRWSVRRIQLALLSSVFLS